MIKDNRYKVIIYAGSQGHNPLTDNVDVEVVFDDGSRYMATIFTIQNIQKIMDGYEASGECMSGFYLWASDMVIVRKISREGIEELVADLISKGELESAFSTTPPSSSE